MVPASSLLRAIIMNTADDVDNPGPDFRTGYGRINVRRAYNMINESRFLTGSVANGGTNSHIINVPANTKQVRVMIVWPDPAAAVNASVGIVNNLNLLAKDPSNTSYNPWVLDASLPSSDTKLNTPAIRGIDNLNTMEQVTVDNPQSGNWTIQVNGNSVPSGPQTYYLTYEFLSNELTYMFPLKDERLQSGSTYNLRWDSYGESGNFSLDYQLDGGSWVNIVNNTDVASRVYQWTAPILQGIHLIKFRVKKGTLTSESDVNYIGPVPENFRISKVCSDVVTLKWSPVTGATSYKVYRLGTKYMEEVTSNINFNGNSAVLTGQSMASSEYYAVSALTGTNEGLKTMSMEKVAGDIGCNSMSWTGAVSTDWFTTGNWSSGVLPTSVDNVIISSAPVNQPLISNTAAVCNNIAIENGASLTMSSSDAYTLSVYGDWNNNGTFNRGIGTVDFAGTNTYQEITGTSTTSFYYLSETKVAVDNILEATSLITLNASTNPFILNSGTFKLSSSSTITPFTNATGAKLSLLKCIWNNGGTINYGNFSWFLDAGRLKISAGTINAGTSSGNTITYLNGGSMTVEGGILNIAGGFSPNSGTSSGGYTQYGGTVTINTAGSASTSRAPFELNSGAPFTMTGGTIVIQRTSSNATADVIISSTTNLVSGGTIQIGNASTPASQTIRINSTVPIYNLTVNATNSPKAQLVTNGLIVKNDVTISGGTLDANNLNLSVGGQWINNSSSFVGTGTVTFNGLVAQTIGGSAATSFNNLTIDGTDVILGTTTSAAKLTSVTGGLTINSGKKLSIPSNQFLTVNGTLTNNAGNTGLIIKSDASGTGSLIQNSSSVPATIERYISGAPVSENSTKYHLVSRPLTEDYTSNEWFGSYLFESNEPDGNWLPIGASTTYPCFANKGYLLYYQEASKTYSHTGNLVNGDKTFNLTFQGPTTPTNYRGYNLIPNVYPCALDFSNAANWTGSASISNKIWIWSSENGNYGSKIRGGASTNSVTDIIPVGQSFFVEATQNGNLTISAAARIHNSSQLFLKNSDIIENTLNLQVKANNFGDEIAIQLRNDATSAYDKDFEAIKREGQYEAPQLSAIASDNAKLSISAFPFSNTDLIVPLHFTLNATTSATFTANGLETFTNHTPVYLEDLLLNKVTNLRENPVYNFMHIANTASNRFQLHFKNTTGINDPKNQISGTVLVDNNFLMITIPSMNDSEVSVDIFDALGRNLSHGKYFLNGTLQIKVPVATGVYIVRVMNSKNTFTQKVLIN